MNSDTAEWLLSHGTKIVKSEQSCKVCSLYGCSKTESYASISLSMYDKLNRHTIIVNNIKVWLLPICPYDIILGRKTLLEKDLLPRIDLSGDKILYNLKTVFDAKQSKISSKTGETSTVSKLAICDNQHVPTDCSCHDCDSKKSAKNKRPDTDTSNAQSQKKRTRFSDTERALMSESTTPMFTKTCSNAGKNNMTNTSNALIEPTLMRDNITSMDQKEDLDHNRSAPIKKSKFYPKSVGFSSSDLMVLNEFKDPEEISPLIEIESILPIDVYKSILDELYAIAEVEVDKQRLLEISQFNLNTNSGVVQTPSQTAKDCSLAGRSNTVNEATLQKMYLAFEVTEPQSKTGTIRISKDQILDPISNDDYIEYDKKPVPWEEKNENKLDRVSVIYAADANPEDKKIIENLVNDFADIFNKNLNKEPAKLDPMVLDVDKEKWCKESNSKPPRPQSQLKRDEIKRQVDKMLELGLIRPSQAAFWSQVHLAPKANNEWRFCIDFRNLNEFTKSMGWPIPNIEQLLVRIGEKKPKYFAVMDFTSGFFQCPLSEESIQLTAFITWCGLFEWVRLPMGLKGAPSWFQQQIAIKVLNGLLYTICELYIDDLIVFGNTIEEYTERLRQVFTRLREKGVILNPSKCVFLMTEVEYLGFLTDKQGIEMTEEKKERALNFELPHTYKKLKQFVGLAEQFHKFIPKFNDLARPLHSILKGYNDLKIKSKPLSFSESDKHAFFELQKAISRSQKLYFVDNNLEIYLRTDASEYGIGAELFQITDSKEIRPVAFISKALQKEQLRWSVPEKEAYGIFYALCRLEHLISYKRCTFYITD